MAEDTITIIVSGKSNVDWIRSKVREGLFDSESEVISESLSRMKGDEDELTQWLKSEGKASYEAYKANPDDVYSLEEVKEEFAALSKPRLLTGQ